MYLRMLFLGTLILATIGCSYEKPTESNQETEVDQPVTVEKIPIKIWLAYDEYAVGLEKAIEERFPNIDLICEHMATIDTRTKVELDGPAGIGADIFIQPHDTLMQSIQGEILLPIGDEISNQLDERFLENAVKSVSFDDVYYGVPISTENIALFYNKTLLNQYGFEVAKTFDEIEAQSKIFNEVEKNKFLIRMETGNPYTMQFVLTSFGYQLFGEEHKDPKLINYKTPEVVEALKFYQSMKEYLPVTSSDLTAQTVDGDFTGGWVPYIITGPWAISGIEQYADFEWGITKIPTINGVQPTTFSGNIVACISRYTNYPDEARQVLEFIASNESLELLYKVEGSIPALKAPSVIDGLAEDKYVLGILEQAEFSEAMPSIPEMEGFWSSSELMYRSVWEGLYTPEEAVKNATDSYYAMLNLMKD